MSYIKEIKEIKYNRTLSKFIDVLDTVHENDFLGSKFYYNQIYTDCNLSLFYFLTMKETLSINMNVIAYYNLCFGLSDNKIITMIHERYKELNYNKIEILLDNGKFEHEIINGMIKW